MVPGPSRAPQPRPEPVDGSPSHSRRLTALRPVGPRIAKPGQEPKRDIAVVQHESGRVQRGHHLTTERLADEISRLAPGRVGQDGERELQRAAGHIPPINSCVAVIPVMSERFHLGASDHVHVAAAPAVADVVARRAG